MYRRAPDERLNDLRYTLQVLEEGSHLGLEDQAADKLRRILLRQIARIEASLSRESNESVRTPVAVPSAAEG